MAMKREEEDNLFDDLDDVLAPAPKVEVKAATKPDPALREPGTRRTDPTGTPVVPQSDAGAPRPDASADLDEDGDDDNDGTDDEEREEVEEVAADEVHPADDLASLEASVVRKPVDATRPSAPPAPPQEPAPAARPPAMPTRAPVVAPKLAEPKVEAKPADAPKPVLNLDPDKRFCSQCGTDVTGQKFCQNDGTPVPQTTATSAVRASTPVSNPGPAPIAAPVVQPQQPTQQPTTVQCENCGFHTAPGRCLNCNHVTGTAAPTKLCRSCKQLMPQGRKFCVHCNHDQTQLSTAEQLAESERLRVEAERERVRLEQERQVLETQLAAAKATPTPPPAPTYQRYCFQCAKDNGVGSTHKFCTGCGKPRREQIS